jgi:hypothetical protein
VPRVHGVDDFGLTLADLERLGPKRVQLEIHLPLPPQIYPGTRLLLRFSALSPRKRLEIVRRWRRERLSRLLKELGGVKYEPIGSARDPVGIMTTVEARSIRKIGSLSNADAAWVRGVEGRRRRRRVGVGSRLYAVKGQLAEKIEGETRGLEQVEERILVIQATSEPAAVRHARRLFKKSETLVMLNDGRYQRGRFERILDVCECPDRDFSPAGTEVFYSFKFRRSRRADMWRPRK